MKTILIVSAGPIDQDSLRLGAEMKYIRQALQRSKVREEWKIECHTAATVDDLRLALLDYRPAILHFSGHGAGEDGLCFEDANGYSHMAQAEPLAKLFHLFSDSLKCVVLNACYSDIQAKAICNEISCVVGMKSTIDDESAIKFAVSFYDAIFAQCSISMAFKMGCNALDLSNLRDSDVPALQTKKGSDPSYADIFDPARTTNATSIKIEQAGLIKNHEADQAQCSTIPIYLDCDTLADGGVDAKKSLTFTFNRLETARVREQDAKVVLTSARYKSLLDQVQDSSKNDGSGHAELSLANEELRLEKLAAPINAIAYNPQINAWLSSIEERVDLALKFCEIVQSPYNHAPDCIDFDLVLRPKLDVSFVFQIPRDIVNEIVTKNGFEKHGGERMITSTWGFDIFDLPVKLVMSEVLPKLIRLVYLPPNRSVKASYSDEHLLNLSNWTFGLH
jgi:hypothetical protein